MSKRSYTHINLIEADYSNARSRKTQARNSGIFWLKEGTNQIMDQPIQSKAKETGNGNCTTSYTYSYTYAIHNGMLPKQHSVLNPTKPNSSPV